MFTKDYFYLSILVIEIIFGIYLLKCLFSISDKKLDKHTEDYEDKQTVKEDVLKSNQDPSNTQFGAIVINITKDSMDIIEQTDKAIVTTIKFLDQIAHNTREIRKIMDDQMDFADDLRYQSAVNTNARRKKFGQPPKYNPVQIWKLKNAKDIRHKANPLH